MISNVLQLPGSSAVKGSPIQAEPEGTSEAFGGKVGSFAGLLTMLGDAIDPAGKEVSEPAESGKVLPDGLPDTLPEASVALLPNEASDFLPEAATTAVPDAAALATHDTLPMPAGEGAIAPTSVVQEQPIEEASPPATTVPAIAVLPTPDSAKGAVPTTISEPAAKAPIQPIPNPSTPTQLPQTQQVLTGEQAVLAAAKGVMTAEPGKIDPKLPEAVTATIAKAARPVTEGKERPSPQVQMQAPPTVSVAVPAPPEAALTNAQPSMLLAPAISGNGALTSAEQPRDFEALIDRLVQAREAAGSSSGGAVRMSIPHAEFGAVNMRFDPSGAAMSVGLSSADTAFIPAVRAALDAGISREENPQSRGDQSSAGSQANQTQNNSGGQSQAHQRFNAEDRAQAGPASGNSPGDTSELAGDHVQTAPTSAEAMRRGFYI